MGKSWREVYKVHPAADRFPMLPEEELRKLGEDIKANGLREPVVVWSPDDMMDMRKPEFSEFLLDGRNRLDAMELVGLQTVRPREMQPSKYLLDIQRKGFAGYRSGVE